MYMDLRNLYTRLENGLPPPGTLLEPSGAANNGQYLAGWRPGSESQSESEERRWRPELLTSSLAIPLLSHGLR